MLLSHSVSGRRTALVPSCAPGINKHSSRRIVLRKQAEKVEAAAADGQRKTAVVAAASAKTDAAPKGAVSDIDRIKAETKVTIFSAQHYVENYMTQPLHEAGFGNIEFLEARLDKQTAGLAEGSPVVCLFVNDNCDAPTVKRLAAAGVKMIAMRCAGFDRVDLKAAEEHGIKVARVPTYSPTSVAEHALSLLMALNRKVSLADTRVRSGNYSLGPLVGMELKGKVCGVIGTGAIGVEAVRIFKGVGMEVLAYDIAKNPAVEAMGVPYMSIEQMLPKADVLSLHLPLLPSTYEIINKPRISMMKHGVILLNVSRGGLINTDEVMEALESGIIGGLGMDVWENEQDLFFTDWTDMDVATRMKAWDRKFKVITSYPQVIITPHSAFLTHEALANIANTTCQNIEEFLAGKPLTNEIKPRK